MNKNGFVKVNLSSTFPFKNRCKYCASQPKHYYYTRTASAFQDHEVIKFINMWISSNHKRMCEDYYLTEMPKHFNTAGSFAHLVDYKGYNPRFHKNHKDHNAHALASTTDHLACNCGRTNWAFNETSAKNRPEIKQRKARENSSSSFLVRETPSLIFF